MSLKVAVIGATRGCGYNFTSQAIEAGHQVSVLVRDPARLQLSDQDKAKIIIHKGDVCNYEDVRKLLKDQDVVVSSIGIRVDMKMIRDGTDVTICKDGTISILEALKSIYDDGLPVPRLIVVSSMGIGEHAKELPYLLWPFYHIVLHKPHIDKDRMEKAVIEASDWLKQWILVRPALLTDGKHTGNYRVIETANGYTISRADVADFIIKNLTSKEWVQKGPVLAY
ncbi:hypothetical protein BC937DRAFT_88718 [Endogone sp. FLAS-F59071]|nr:hypothetical protein BC937DRAFT_88718 [Endogone sp. FLAS-F59071]|eukprot:RUS22505.1 hypothetical protein BC937DRAFT_88718 [Endogone sp. FLAS-F59071]